MAEKTIVSFLFSVYLDLVQEGVLDPTNEEAEREALALYKGEITPDRAGIFDTKNPKAPLFLRAFHAARMQQRIPERDIGGANNVKEVKILQDERMGKFTEENPELPQFRVTLTPKVPASLAKIRNSEKFFERRRDQIRSRLKVEQTRLHQELAQIQTDLKNLQRSSEEEEAKVERELAELHRRKQRLQFKLYPRETRRRVPPGDSQVSTEVKKGEKKAEAS